MATSARSSTKSRCGRTDVPTVTFGDVLAADDAVGVLTRETRLRMVNISASGGLVESVFRLEPGTTGQLRVRVGDRNYSDDVRITRVVQVHGASVTWQAGAEFLWTSQPGAASLRRLAARVRLGLDSVAVEFAVAGQRPM